MHLDPIILRAAAIVAVLIVVYGSQMTKGSMTKTPEGLVFAIKPLIAWTRLPILILIVVYVMTARIHTAPWWVYLTFFAAIAFIVAQMPGTITLTPTAITQRFWFRPSKAIQYNEVMAIQSGRAGTTRVLGDNRVTITHTLNHSASAEFQQGLEHRTGKRVTA
jgi:small-conductance mechanosensitive channel